MTDMTYDPEADAPCIYLGIGKVHQTIEHGPLMCDVDANGKIIGVEILFASRTLADGSWKNAPLPGSRADAAE